MSAKDNDWLNTEINSLFTKYSISKVNLQPLSAEVRKELANDLIEEYFAIHQKMPDSRYIDRLSTFILLDELTDMSRTKSANAEYAFLSDTQLYRRKVRESLLEEVYFDMKASSGTRTYRSEHLSLLNKEVSEERKIETELEFLRVCEDLKLESLDVLIVWETVFSEATVRSLEKLTGLKKSAISTRLNKAIDMIRKSDLKERLSNNGQNHPLSKLEG